jgi:trigger factor
LRREHAVLKTAEEGHEIATDDVAIVDFQGFHEGNAMEQVHNEDYAVDVGEGRLGEEFEAKLIGMKKGEKTLYEIDFPADYPNPVLAAKTVEFKVDIKDVKVRVRPELDDEFAKDINEEYENIDDLRAGVRKQLEEAKAKSREGDMHDRLMHKLLEMHEFEVPHRLVFYEIEEMVKQTEANLERSNLTLESAGIKREELAEQNKELAEKRVRGDFILKAIGEKEEIQLSDEDIERGYQRIATQYNMDVAQVKGYFTRREELLPFMNELLNEKVLAFLRDNAKIIEVEETEEAPEAEATEES